MATDRLGHIVQMNPTAEALTGWPLKQALGQPLKTVFKIHSAVSGRSVRNPFSLVISRGVTVGLANHTVLVSKTGQTHHIADTAAPIRDPTGHIRGVVIVFKDVSLDYARAKSLRESEERLRTFFTEATDGIVVANARTRRIVEVNPRILAMTQSCREDLLGAAIDVLHPPLHLSLIREAFARIARSQEHLAMNIPVQRRDGSSFMADINATAMNWAGERCVVGIFRDITPRQQIERALLESEAKFRRIIETTPHGVHLYRLQDDGRLVFVGANPAADRILGVRNQDFVGKTIEEAFPPLAEMDIPEAYRTVARTGQPWHSEQVTYQDNRITGVYDVHAFQTQPLGVAAMFEDITSRKAIERALRENEQRFRTLVENTLDYILRIDRQAGVRLASPSLLNLLGLPMEGSVGVPVDELGLPSPLASRILEEVRWVFDTGAIRTLDADVALAGRTMCLNIRLVPEPNEDGDVSTVLAVARDVTELEHMQRQMRQVEKMEAVGQLAGGIAHDFNNQLAGILGYAELLKLSVKEGTEDSRQVNNILKIVHRASDLAGQLLAFSRRGKRERVSTPLGEIVEEVIALLQHSVDKRIRIVFKPPAKPLYVQGDPTQLQNVLLNVGINARDAMPDGGTLTFALSSCQLDESFSRQSLFEITPGVYAHLSVTDTGAGMAPEVAAHIFEPFFTTKAEGHGTGMGLAAAFGAMKSHKGAIEVVTVPGKGSTFSFYLPLIEPGPDAARTPRQVAGTADRLKGHVLIVDDEEEVADVGRRLTEALGCQVTVSRDGREAIETYRRLKESIDLVILDLIMPEMNGTEVMKVLRTIRPDVKVLVSSGYVQEAQEVLKAGAIGFVPKPFTMEDLRLALATALCPK